MNRNTNKDTMGGSKGLYSFCCFFVVISASNMGIQMSRRNNQGWFSSQHGFPLLGAHGHLQHPVCKCPHAHSLHRHHPIVTPASLNGNCLCSLALPTANEITHTPCHNHGTSLAAGLAMSPRNDGVSALGGAKLQFSQTERFKSSLDQTSTKLLVPPIRQAHLQKTSGS